MSFVALLYGDEFDFSFIFVTLLQTIIAKGSSQLLTHKKLEAIAKIGFWFKFSRRILAGQERGTEFQPADILKYFEELKLGPNTEIGTKDFFEMASKKSQEQT